MTETLKPCPFCQQSASKLMAWDVSGRAQYQVHCMNCGTGGPQTFAESAEAIAAWNHRPLEDAAEADASISVDEDHRGPQSLVG